jgi:tetratricopeptide (TPR) repeat protein/predicted Ser/Thr protein kinase
MDPQAGARVSHYQLVRKLGSGGMGDVYLADDLDLGRAVAIKFLNAPTDARARQRLLNEARAAAALDHPVICGVHEVGSDPLRGDFIVMQYVEGETLAAAVNRGPMAREQALAIAADIADALAAAHQHGVVHRDLKPQNIVLQPSGRAKLLDFGIAKRTTSDHEAAEAATVTPLTRPHSMIGTPSYMSPEQVKGEAADARSDLFALGCVMYECITGRRAFGGATEGEVFGRILHAEPPPMSTVTRVDPDLDALVARLLRKSAAERFQSASEVVGAIRTLRGLTSRERSGSWPGSMVPKPAPRSYFLVAGVALVVVAAIALWWRSGALPAPPAEARAWYDRGVEALRDGAYATARTSFQQAVDLFQDYAFAYSRLAEACAELDDEDGANDALHRAAAFGNRWRVPREERLRLDAVRWTVLRDYPQAIDTYDSLLVERPNDAGLWVDAGRAEEARGHNDRALAKYAKAVQIDSQYAAAHMRLGSAQGRAGRNDEALASLNHSIRLYRDAGRIEGEAEAYIRKGERLSTLGQNVDARESLRRAIAITADERYLAKRLRARFLLARLDVIEGRAAEGQADAEEAVDAAIKAGLHRDAASGLIELANARARLGAYDHADADLVRAMEFAGRKGARVTEMRARLQQGYLRVQQKRPEEGVALVEVAYKFASEGRHRSLLTQTRSVLSRIYDALFRYEEALRVAKEGLALAEADENPSLIGESCENTAGILHMTGRLPEALVDFTRASKIHRERQLHGALQYDLGNLAELFLRLNRPRDAQPLLDELSELIRTNPAYKPQADRLARLRVFEAIVAGRLDEAEKRAAALADDRNQAPGATAIYGRVMREYVRAKSGRSREATAGIAPWAARDSLPSFEELPFWVAKILLARNAPAPALAVVEEAMRSPAVEQNPELRWRLAVLASRAIRAGASSTTGRDYRALAEEDRKRLNAAWGGDATTYFARADLADLQ